MEAATEQLEASDVAAAAAGDARAFERLYRRHVGRVHGLARRMAGPHAADELTQDIFVRAWEKLDTFRGEAAFGSWLYRLGVNVIYNRQRKAGARARRIIASEAAVAAAPAPRRRLEAVLDFEEAIEKLPEGARQVFVLHDVEGYKHREIAQLLDVTAGTSKSQLHRARMLLREQMDR